MKAHVIEWPCLTPKDIAKSIGVDLALKDDFTAINNEEVKINESTSVGNTSEEDKS